MMCSFCFICLFSMLLDFVKSIFPVHVFHKRGKIDFGRWAMKLFRGCTVLIWFDGLVVVFGCMSLLYVHKHISK